jgi:hypothetical protein
MIRFDYETYLANKLYVAGYTANDVKTMLIESNNTFNLKKNGESKRIRVYGKRLLAIFYKLTQS